MSSEWHRGVLDASSWHGLETIGKFATHGDMIAQGEQSGAWPQQIGMWPMLAQTGSGEIEVPGRRAVVGYYAAHPKAVVGDVTDAWHPTSPEAWRGLVEAACLAGAQPTGAFSLRGGSRVLATFDVGGNGIRTHLLLADAFDGSMSLTCGQTSVRVVCANTLAVSLGRDIGAMARLRHSASLESKVALLTGEIGNAIKAGEAVRERYAAAEAMRLDRTVAQGIFDALFPAAPEGSDKALVTKRDNARAEAQRAMGRAENNVGSTLATIWNGATWLVDRDADGNPRKTRGDAGRLDSMLFGARAKRVQEIQTVIEVCMRDGTSQAMSATDAAELGVDLRQIGARVLDDILDGAE